MASAPPGASGPQGPQGPSGPRDPRHPAMGSAEMARFIVANTTVAAPPLTPQLRVYQATQITPLWQATEQMLEETGLPPPFWAFPWAGGQAVARLALDDPGLVRGRAVLDFGAGNGLIAIAAERMGARRVVAADVDPFAEIAQHLNARLNRVAIETTRHDLTGNPLREIDVVLAGDVLYERPTARRIVPWLRGLVAAGKTVLFGDPGRAYLPQDGLEPVAAFSIPTPIELEDREIRETTVWRLLPG